MKRAGESSRRCIAAAVWVAFVLTPAHVGAPLHGIPLGGIDTCTLLAIAWLTARRRRLPGAPIVAVALVATIALAAGMSGDRGFRARYFANPDAQPPFELSTEYRSRSFTRIDERLDFAPRGREFPLAFFNDIQRFNLGKPGEPDRERLSFSVFWEGFWWQKDASPRTLFVEAPDASAQIIVDDERVVSVRPGETTVTAVVTPAPGWHRLDIRFSSPYRTPRRFAAGELVGDRRSPFDANTIVTRRMDRRQLLLARAFRVAKTAFDIVAMGWLALLVFRDVVDLLRKRRADGAVLSNRQWALAWFAIVAIVEAYVFASPWLSRLFVHGGGDDPLTYEFYARDIQLHGLLLYLDEPYYYQAFYPYFLAATHAVFGEGMFGVLLVQRLLIALVVWMCVEIAVRIGGERVWPAAFLCAAFVAYAELAPISTSTRNESLFVPLLVTWTAAMVRVCQSPTGRRVVGAAVLGGVTALTRTTALLAWGAAFPVCWLAWKNVSRRRWFLAALVLCSVSIVALIAVRNWIVVHRFVPLPTELPITLLSGNEPPPGVKLDYSRRGPLYDRLALNGNTRQVVEYAITAPGMFAANMGRKVLFALGFYEPYAAGWGYSLVFLAVSLLSIVGGVVALRARVAPPLVVGLPALIAISQFIAVVVVYPKGVRLILPFHTVLLPYVGIAVERALRFRSALPAASTFSERLRLRLGASAVRITGPAMVGILGVYTFVIRTRGISEHFLMLGDQIRDWSIALGPFSRLPLVGTPSTAGGNSFGPIFYWVLWLIRVAIGPFFDNLPHAGGIGLAAAQSCADGVLCVGIKRASGSWTFAIATVLIIASSPFDLALSSVIWNPVLAVALTKTAMGLVLCWREALTTRRRVVLGVVAWLAVQAHSAALPFSAAIFLWIFWTAWNDGSRRLVAAIGEAAVIVLVLQLPSFFTPESIQPTKLWALALHPEQLRPLDAFRAVGEAAAFIAASPFQLPHVPLLLIGAAVALCVTGGLPAVVFVTVVPLAIAVGLWSLWQGESYESYAFLTLAPSAVLLVAWICRLPQERYGRAVATAALLVGAVAMLPPRREHATSVFRMPSYGALVRGSRALVAQHESVRRIEAPFLPPLSNAEFVYTILGGTISRDSQVVAHLTARGEVTYEP